MEIDSAEDFAQVTLKEARLDGADRPNPLLVAKRLGVGVFVAPKTLRWSELGQTALVDGKVRVYVRADVDEPRRAIVVAHELGHVVARRARLDLGDHEERWCWRFGAALMAPSVVVRKEWRAADEQLDAMFARWPQMPPTAVALRVGESMDLPTWIVQGRRTILRHANEPSDGVLDIAAEAHERGVAVRPGLRAVRLDDGTRRAAVLAA